MDQTNFLWLFLGIGVAYLLIGLYASRHITSKVDYFLASRNYGVFAVTMTLVATQIGGGLVLGTANESYNAGIYGIAYSVGIVLGFIILALGIARKLRSFNVETTSQLFETQYDSTLLRKVSAVMMILSLSGILAGQVVASRMFLHGLGVHHEGLFLVFWAFIIIYTVMGGLKAVVLTNIYQILFIFVLFAGLFFWAQDLYPLESINWQPSTDNALALEFNWQTVVPMFLLPLMFCVVEQDLAQRFFSARNQKVATLAALASAVIILAFAIIPTYFGILGKQLNLDIPENASVFIAVMRALTSDVVLALIACGLLAAIVSTAASLLCAISSNLAQDFGSLAKTPAREVMLSRFITLASGVFAIVVAYYMDNILQVLIQSLELPVTCLFASIFFCCVLKRVYKLAAMVSVFAGLATFIIFKIYPTPFPNEVIQIAASFLGYGVGWMFAKKD